MKKIIAVALLSSLFAVPAMAAVPGAYVALDLQNWSATNTGAFGNPGMGLRIGAGYRFTPNVGVEVDYGQSGKSTSVAGADYKIDAAQIAVVGTYPINPEFDVFAKVGASSNKASTSGYTVASSSKTDVMFGLGGQYNINQQFGVRLQYEDVGKVTNSGTNDYKATTISLGVVYAF